MYTTSPKQTLATQAIPTTVYAQGEKLFVHTGADGFKVIAAVGELGKVNVASGYPTGFGVKTDTRWTNDHYAIAEYAARAINAYPTLSKRVSVLESRNADLLAKLNVAKVALQRKDKLDAAYLASLVGEIERSVVAAGKAA